MSAARIAEAKQAADIVDVVGAYVALKRRGAVSWGRCPFHSDRTPSFKVDPGRGRWHCFGCDADGDALDFICRIENLTLPEALERLAPLDRQPRRRPPDRPAEPEPDAPSTHNQERAQEIWRQTESIPAGLPFAYLTQRRGITDWDRDTVRWHPQCPWGSGTAGCIVCPVTSHVTGLTTAIWRIRPVMAGKVERMGLGPVKGNCSQLFWPTGDELALAEGVEDAAAFHQLTGMPTWAALYAGNMGVLVLPPRLRRVVIVQDNDAADGPGPKAAQELAQRLRAEGREARIIASDFGKDANDALLRRRAS